MLRPWHLLQLWWSLWWQRGWRMSVSRNGLAFHTALGRRRSARPEAAAPPVPAAQRDATTLVAEALCSLMSDPKAPVTRVHVVGASPPLLDAVEASATRAGELLVRTQSAAPGAGSIIIERTLASRSDAAPAA